MPTLQWLTRDTELHIAARAPYRLLEESPELSAGDLDAGNMLLQGDNLNKELHSLSDILSFFLGNDRQGASITSNRKCVTSNE